MNTTGLYDLFRADVVDTVQPYLWSDDEVFRYMDEAQIMFCRLGFGIADVTTPEVVRVPVTAGEEYADLHPSILTIRQARLASTGREIAIRNLLDAATAGDDYGIFVRTVEHRPGPVRGVVIGEEQDKCRWVSIPEVDDEVILSVYRLPLAEITGDTEQEFEIRREHHMSLMLWMKHLAYLKQDAETFDRAKSKENEERFIAYCDKAKAEWSRYMHKPRSIKYGGIGGFGDYGPTSVRRNW